MPTFNPSDFWYLAPEIVLSAWGGLVLLVDVLLMRRWAGTARRHWLGGLSLAGALAGLYASWTTTTTNVAPFFGTIDAGRLTLVLNVLLTILLALVVVLSISWDFTKQWGEYFALLFWSTVGMMLLVAAKELLILFLTLEMMTICLYLCTAFEKSQRRSSEAGLKYFVYGSVSSALFLFGLSLLYGLAGSTRFDAIARALEAGASAAPGLSGNLVGATALLLIFVGFGFKVAAVPFHQWAPDAYEGAPAPVTAWVATGSKLASFVVMMKLLLNALGPWWRGADDSLLTPGWVGLVAAISALTMTYGNFAALGQRNLKRMLAYSSISHAGYMLVGVLGAGVSHDREAASGVLFYLTIYAFTTVGAFALAAWLFRDLKRDDIDDLNGLVSRSPMMAVCVTLLMLSLIGMPPLAGFFGKFYMFSEALNAAEKNRLTMVGLVALGLFNSVVSAFYYLRVLKAMFLREPNRGAAMGAPPISVWFPVSLSTVVVVLFGVWPRPLLTELWDAAKDEAGFFPRPAVAAAEAAAPPIRVKPLPDDTAAPRPEAATPPAPTKP